MEKGIWAISHLMDNYGNFLYYSDLCDKFNLQCSIREYNKVMKAIPVPLQTMIQQFVLYSNTIPEVYKEVTFKILNYIYPSTFCMKGLIGRVIHAGSVRKTLKR